MPTLAPATPSKPAPGLWKPALAAAGALLAFLVIYGFSPRDHSFYPRCAFHSLTGLHCPGCGTLRGLHELAHGHPFTALRMNLLVFIGLPALVAAHLWQRRRRQEKGLIQSLLDRPAAGWTALAVVVLFWVLRNVPIYPFTLLAP
jgi:hypothetical protein